MINIYKSTVIIQVFLYLEIPWLPCFSIIIDIKQAPIAARKIKQVCFCEKQIRRMQFYLRAAQTVSLRKGESSQLYSLQACFFCYIETSQRPQMLALTAVVSHFQPDIMSFKTSSLLPRSGDGAWVIGLEKWRNWTKGRNKHGLIFILKLSVWHLFTLMEF